MTVENIPRDLVLQARELMTNGYYSSKFTRDILKRVIGFSTICGQIAEKLVTEKHDNINLLSRYCDKCYIERYQKHKHKKKRKRVKLG